MSFSTLLASTRPRLPLLVRPDPPAALLSTTALFQAAWSGRGSQSSRPRGRFNKGVYEEDETYAPRQASWDANEGGRAGPSGWDRDANGDGFEARPRKPIRKKMPRNPPPPGPPSAEEMAKRERMRVARAERLERMDLTSQLTPQKTCKSTTTTSPVCYPPPIAHSSLHSSRAPLADMGGFTQPKHLRFLNPLDPTRKGKDSHQTRISGDRVRPAEEAYEPHSVFLAVTRHPVRWGHGRATRREVFSGFCKTVDLAEQFRRLNYGVWLDAREASGSGKNAVEAREAQWTAPSESKEYCELAVWPGSSEERSILNRPFYLARKVWEKEAALAREKGEPEPAAPEVAFIPPVSAEWQKPLPPYTSPPIILPLVTVTLPTRPLAATLARLCNAHERGLPFIASIPNADRKDGPAMFRRLLRMRSDRTRQLARDIAERLDGMKGGFFGLRMSAEDIGRGMGEGEGLGVRTRERGTQWAEVSWLEEGSRGWDGIQRDMFLADWKETEEVRVGARLTEEGRKVGEEPARVEQPAEVAQESVAGQAEEPAQLAAAA